MNVNYKTIIMFVVLSYLSVELFSPKDNLYIKTL